LDYLWTNVNVLRLQSTANGCAMSRIGLDRIDFG